MSEKTLLRNVDKDPFAPKEGLTFDGCKSFQLFGIIEARICPVDIQASQPIDESLSN